ncbi:polysaccharide lyase [Rhypophila decipiens]|uniref:Polysaccharide lyase n=1 Tax=Rhypophila decipiens TaxID=261697 RepID=A0AAN6XXJ3_9PEZI|nr:polysaccharide lyase [Rhypophila decipiens]
MVHHRLLMAALAALAPLHVAQATQLFSNHGTRNPGEWSSINEEHNGKVSQVSNVAYEGTTALKMTQTYDSNWDGRYHSEVVMNNAYSKGDTRFYGFAFRLSETWEFSDENFNIAQFIADFGYTGCDDYMPTTMVWLHGARLYTRRKYGSVCSKPQPIETYDSHVDVTAGVWHKIVMQVKWASDSTGYIKMWYDGAKVVEDLGVPTTIAEDKPFQFRVGLYANGWHDNNHNMKGTQGFRQVWFDEIAFGTTFADADPAQW